MTVTQTGCIGICQFEPVVEIFEAGKEKVTYVKMTAEKAEEVVENHLKGGKVIEDYTISTFERLTEVKNGSFSGTDLRRYRLYFLRKQS